MNYGVKATKKRIRAANSRKKKYANRLFLTFFKTAFVLVLFLCVTGASTFIGMFKGILDSSPDFNPDSFTPSGYFSTIYNSAGEVTDTLVGSNSNRIEASYEDFPQDLIDAFVSIEDSRFWQHSGIDLRSISRAVVGVLTNNYKGGASTLTQQLIKNTVFNGGMETSKGSKIERKIQEQYLALQLTKNVDRKVILTNYLNTINLGSNTLGVKAAALRYFNKNVSDLTLSECAVIAGITQNPSKLNPISGAEANAARRKVILQAMYEQGYITKEEQEEALADDVYARIQNVDTALKENETPYSYYTDELISQVTEALKEQLGYTDTQASNLLFSGGLQIYTPQDPQIQAIVDATKTPTPEQVRVVEAPRRPLLVVAGAGSGKTETMSMRVLWLLANHPDVTPASILGLTFTRKAAGELGDRLRERIRLLSRELPQMRERLDEDIRGILAVGGITVHTESPVDAERMAQLSADYDAVYVAIGAQTGKGLRIDGTDAEGVFSAVDLLGRIGDGDYPRLHGQEGGRHRRRPRRSDRGLLPVPHGPQGHRV